MSSPPDSGDYRVSASTTEPHQKEMKAIQTDNFVLFTPNDDPVRSMFKSNHDLIKQSIA